MENVVVEPVICEVQPLKGRSQRGAGTSLSQRRGSRLSILCFYRHATIDRIPPAGDEVGTGVEVEEGPTLPYAGRDSLDVIIMNVQRLEFCETTDRSREGGEIVIRPGEVLELGELCDDFGNGADIIVVELEEDEIPEMP